MKKEFDNNGFRCCPMCGHHMLYVQDKDGYYEVYCMYCSAKMALFYSSRRALKRAWNRFKRVRVEEVKLCRI